MKYIFLMIILSLPLAVFGEDPTADAATCDCSNENMDCSERGLVRDIPNGDQTTGGNSNISLGDQ